MANKHRILIIGGNFAGLSAARELSRLSKGTLEITLLDPSSSFNWTPNIHEILSGVKLQSGVSVSRSTMLQNLGVNFLEQSVVTLDHESKQLTLDSGETLAFDACILACGYGPRNDELPERHFQFRKAADVQQIREAIETQKDQKPSLENNSSKNINITIVGGGFTGVEALGELLRKVTFDNRFNITVVESAERLVNSLDAVVAEDIVKLTQAYGVSFRLGCKVVQAHPDELELSDGKSLVSDITIWSAGGRVPEFLINAGLAETESAGIAVNSCLQALLCDDCFVAGDIANWSAEDSTSANKLPKQSYHAIDMGNLAAQNLFRHLQQQKLQSYQPNPKPILLALGDINTYLISGDSVLASPLLAATKEALYQVSMHKLMTAETLYQRKKSFFQRLARSAERLLLPELHPANLLNILSRSRVLKKGSAQDLVPLLQGARSTLFDGF